MTATEKQTTSLHLVASSSSSALTDCLRQAMNGDSIVFIDAGVMHLVLNQEKGVEFTKPGIRFSYADLEARGLTAMARNRGVEILDDRATACLLLSHDHCLTWK